MKVITLVHDRQQQLANLIKGLEASNLPPEELWIVHMNEAPSAWVSHRFAIHSCRVDGIGGLPLAKARNSVATLDPLASWVFLDVDCIPAGNLLTDYRNSLTAQPDALHMGQVRYLPEGATRSDWTEATLLEQGIAHPLAAFRTAPGSALPHHLFWSLNFACQGSTFTTIGGFDQGFRGYGAEDTDFAFRARQQGVPVIDSPALAFHQYHPTFDPPLNHFADIVANARRFHRRWDVWPMEGWLNALRERGLVYWDDERLEIIQTPTAAQVAQALKADRLGF
ncbi:galactosyltransferase-related protein [Pseudomonas sp. dw_358]|uniref:glycosyltransferase family 2 protein n=1 Tax=Pseudomonas sp. dw_358 TaxID=2720083 RepID=UPI001BD40E70|nr:galactosyltransferase-related protein [Pseudomonas sp. dw_358]